MLFWCLAYLLFGYTLFHALWFYSDYKFACKEYLGGLVFTVFFWPLGLIWTLAAIVEDLIQ